MAFSDEIHKKKNLSEMIVEDTKIKSLILHLSPKKKLRKNSCVSNEIIRIRCQRSENEDRISSNNEFLLDLYNSSLDHTINQAEYGLRLFNKYRKVQLKERIEKGPPESFRWISWVIYANLPDDRSE